MLQAPEILSNSVTGKLLLIKQILEKCVCLDLNWKIVKTFLVFCLLSNLMLI